MTTIEKPISEILMKSFIMWPLAKIVSWYKGRTMGEKRYIKALPFIVGQPMLIIPELMNQTERNATRFRVYEERWNGFGWDHVQLLELSMEELKHTLDRSPT